jgi:hypothetical protein
MSTRLALVSVRLVWHLSVRMIHFKERPTKDDFIKWLDAPDPSGTHNRLKEEHHEGTGQWFLDSDEFAQWLDGRCSILWINGIREYSSTGTDGAYCVN